ncbi:hypothetical protein [Nocardioides sp. B-3]|uniref:hypothetical protein n=1 Tax=Nocardioides sp. B-3 TaxID=2895565 RepID=UPI0021521803|nr:hypothetical protein [Nocardioides sp. B-3]UUZ61468.1 hypothetical protein LP418_13395 [Nocardioides sp. B-3]
MNGNALSPGNGTTVTPCIPNAPIHMRIGYADGGTGASVAGSTTQFTTDGITFPRREVHAYEHHVRGVDSRQQHDRPADDPQARRRHPDGRPQQRRHLRFVAVWVDRLDALREELWPTGFAQSDDAMLVHMRLKNLQILKNGYMTVVPQANPAAPTAVGTGEYRLTFTPANRGTVGWNIGDACVYTDLWLRADTHIKVNVFGINTTVGDPAGDDSLWGSILSSIATGNVDGLELDAWVYYMNTNKGSCTGTPTTLNMPNTGIAVTP